MPSPDPAAAAGPDKLWAGAGSPADDASQLGLVQEALGIATWIWEPDAGHVRWYGDLSPMLGLPGGGFSGGYDDYLRRLHPDDREGALRLMRDCLKGRQPSYRAEERVIWPDGSVHWLETYGRGSYRDDGRALSLAGVVREVTARKQAEQALAASEARFRGLIEAAPVAIGMSRGERMFYANPAFATLFGLAGPQAAVGMQVLDRVAPTQRQWFEQRTRAREAGGPVPDSYELEVLRADGSPFTCMVAVTTVELADGQATLVMLHDMSDRARARAELERERDRARLLLQVAQAILVAVDEQGRITMINRRGCQLLGWSEDELIGRDWFATCRDPTDAAASAAQFVQLMAGGLTLPEYNESRVRTRGGELRDVAWRRAVLTDGAGRITGLLGSGEDITEQLRARRALQALAASLEERVRERTAELARSNAALAEARDAAEAATRAKGDFLANMSHEIRTPMNAIVGLSDLGLRQSELTPRLRGYLANIRRAAGSLLQIVNQILDFSKIEAGQLEFEVGEFDLDEMLERVTSLVALEATERGLDFLISVAPDVPRRLVGDPLRIGQVLLNLCGNAVKFTDRGEVVVTTTCRADDVAGRVRVRFAVRDTGVGIDPSVQPRLFRPFDQLDASITRRFGGTGLGLAIARQLVLTMGGAIDMRSAPGEGSEFYFELPLTPAPPAAAANAVAPLPAAHILVVDDSANARTIFEGLLGVMGSRHRTVESADAALVELTRADTDPYDLVLLDWKMPQCDGFEAARRIRAALPPARRPRLVLVTAYGDDDVAARAHDDGFDGYLAKPVGEATLRAAIAAAFGAGGAPAAPIPPPAVPDVAAQLRGRRLLLVEDNELNRIVATDLLAGVAGAVVVVAANGREALDRLAAQAFDLVLMDLQMPVMDGYEATRRLRADPRLAGLPVVAMTAHAMARDRELCVAAGMDDFVPKPFEPQTLFSVVARVLRQRGDPAPLAAGDDGAALSPPLGLARCLGRPGLYETILQRFVQTHADDPVTMRKALAAGDAVAVGRLAHALVSTAGTIGAEPLSALARELQLAIGRGDDARWPSLVERFADEHERVLAAVRSLFAPDGAFRL